MTKDKVVRTVEEKIKFNYNRKTAFGWGYVNGAKAYERYMRAKAEQEKLLSDINDSSVRAKKGHKYDQGVMCGVRDMAKKYKNKK